MSDERDDLDELLGAYAVDALDDEERRRVEERLTRDPEARAEADRLADAMAEVAIASIEPVAPPPDLWERIAAELPATQASPDPGPSADVPRAQDLPVGDELATRRAHRASRARWPLAAAVAAAAAVVAGLLVGVVVARDTTDPSLSDQLAQEAERVEGEAGAQVVELSGEDPAITARVVIDDEGRGIVLAQGLPPLEADQTYQLWSVAEDAVVSLGLLGSQPGATLVGTDGRVQQLAITAEPAGGSVVATTDPVVVGTPA